MPAYGRTSKGLRFNGKTDGVFVPMAANRDNDDVAAVGYTTSKLTRLTERSVHHIPSSFTIEAWVIPDYGGIVAEKEGQFRLKIGTTSAAAGIEFTIWPADEAGNGSEFKVTSTRTFPNANFSGNSNQTIKTRELLHIAGIFTGSTIEVFVNNQKMATTVINGNWHIPTVNSDIWIGGKGGEYKGVIESVHLRRGYNKESFALTGFAKTTDSLGLWRFEELADIPTFQATLTAPTVINNGNVTVSVADAQELVKIASGETDISALPNPYYTDGRYLGGGAAADALMIDASSFVSTMNIIISHSGYDASGKVVADPPERLRVFAINIATGILTTANVYPDPILGVKAVHPTGSLVSIVAGGSDLRMNTYRSTGFDVFSDFFRRVGQVLIDESGGNHGYMLSHTNSVSFVTGTTTMPGQTGLTVESYVNGHQWLSAMPEAEQEIITQTVNGVADEFTLEFRHAPQSIKDQIPLNSKLTIHRNAFYGLIDNVISDSKIQERVVDGSANFIAFGLNSIMPFLLKGFDTTTDSTLPAYFLHLTPETESRIALLESPAALIAAGGPEYIEVHYNAIDMNGTTMHAPGYTAGRGHLIVEKTVPLGSKTYGGNTVTSYLSGGETIHAPGGILTFNIQRELKDDEPLLRSHSLAGDNTGGIATELKPDLSSCPINGGTGKPIAIPAKRLEVTTHPSVYHKAVFTATKTDKDPSTKAVPDDSTHLNEVFDIIENIAFHEASQMQLIVQPTDKNRTAQLTRASGRESAKQPNSIAIQYLMMTGRVERLRNDANASYIDGRSLLLESAQAISERNTDASKNGAAEMELHPDNAVATMTLGGGGQGMRDVQAIRNDLPTSETGMPPNHFRAVVGASAKEWRRDSPTTDTNGRNQTGFLNSGAQTALPLRSGDLLYVKDITPFENLDTPFHIMLEPSNRYGRITFEATWNPVYNAAQELTSASLAPVHADMLALLTSYGRGLKGKRLVITGWTTPIAYPYEDWELDSVIGDYTMTDSLTIDGFIPLSRSHTLTGPGIGATDTIRLLCHIESYYECSARSSSLSIRGWDGQYDDLITFNEGRGRTSWLNSLYELRRHRNANLMETGNSEVLIGDEYIPGGFCHEEIAVVTGITQDSDGCKALTIGNHLNWAHGNGEKVIAYALKDTDDGKRVHGTASSLRHGQQLSTMYASSRAIVEIPLMSDFFFDNPGEGVFVREGSSATLTVDVTMRSLMRSRMMEGVDKANNVTGAGTTLQDWQPDYGLRPAVSIRFDTTADEWKDSIISGDSGANYYAIVINGVTFLLHPTEAAVTRWAKGISNVGGVGVKTGAEIAEEFRRSVQSDKSFFLTTGSWLTTDEWAFIDGADNSQVILDSGAVWGGQCFVVKVARAGATHEVVRPEDAIRKGIIIDRAWGGLKGKRADGSLDFCRPMTIDFGAIGIDRRVQYGSIESACEEIVRRINQSSASAALDANGKSAFDPPSVLNNGSPCAMQNFALTSYVGANVAAAITPSDIGGSGTHMGYVRAFMGRSYEGGHTVVIHSTIPGATGRQFCVSLDMSKSQIDYEPPQIIGGVAPIPHKGYPTAFRSFLGGLRDNDFGKDDNSLRHGDIFTTNGMGTRGFANAACTDGYVLHALRGLTQSNGLMYLYINRRYTIGAGLDNEHQPFAVVAYDVTIGTNQMTFTWLYQADLSSVTDDAGAHLFAPLTLDQQKRFYQHWSIYDDNAAIYRRNRPGNRQDREMPELMEPVMAGNELVNEIMAGDDGRGGTDTAESNYYSRNAAWWSMTLPWEGVGMDAMTWNHNDAAITIRADREEEVGSLFGSFLTPGSGLANDLDSYSDLSDADIYIEIGNTPDHTLTVWTDKADMTTGPGLQGQRAIADIRGLYKVKAAKIGYANPPGSLRVQGQDSKQNPQSTFPFIPGAPPDYANSNVTRINSPATQRVVPLPIPPKAEGDVTGYSVFDDLAITNHPATTANVWGPTAHAPPDPLGHVSRTGCKERACIVLIVEGHPFAHSLDYLHEGNNIHTESAGVGGTGGDTGAAAQIDTGWTKQFPGAGMPGPGFKGCTYRILKGGKGLSSGTKADSLLDLQQWDLLSYGVEGNAVNPNQQLQPKDFQTIHEQGWEFEDHTGQKQYLRFWTDTKQGSRKGKKLEGNSRSPTANKDIFLNYGLGGMKYPSASEGYSKHAFKDTQSAQEGGSRTGSSVLADHIVSAINASDSELRPKDSNKKNEQVARYHSKDSTGTPLSHRYEASRPTATLTARRAGAQKALTDSHDTSDTKGYEAAWVGREPLHIIANNFGARSAMVRVKDGRQSFAAAAQPAGNSYGPFALETDYKDFFPQASLSAAHASGGTWTLQDNEAHRLLGYCPNGVIASGTANCIWFAVGEPPSGTTGAAAAATGGFNNATEKGGALNILSASGAHNIITSANSIAEPFNIGTPVYLVSGFDIDIIKSDGTIYEGLTVMAYTNVGSSFYTGGGVHDGPLADLQQMEWKELKTPLLRLVDVGNTVLGGAALVLDSGDTFRLSGDVNVNPKRGSRQLCLSNVLERNETDESGPIWENSDTQPFYLIINPGGLNEEIVKTAPQPTNTVQGTKHRNAMFMDYHPVAAFFGATHAVKPATVIQEGTEEDDTRGTLYLDYSWVEGDGTPINKGMQFDHAIGEPVFLLQGYHNGNIRGSPIDTLSAYGAALLHRNRSLAAAQTFANTAPPTVLMPSTYKPISVTAITSATDATITVPVSTPHGFAIGDTVIFTGITNYPADKEMYYHVQTVPSVNTFTCGMDSATGPALSVGSHCFVSKTPGFHWQNYDYSAASINSNVTKTTNAGMCDGAPFAVQTVNTVAGNTVIPVQDASTFVAQLALNPTGVPIWFAAKDGTSYYDGTGGHREPCNVVSAANDTASPNTVTLKYALNKTHANATTLPLVIVAGWGNIEAPAVTVCKIGYYGELKCANQSLSNTKGALEGAPAVFNEYTDNNNYPFQADIDGEEGKQTFVIGGITGSVLRLHPASMPPARNIATGETLRAIGVSITSKGRSTKANTATPKWIAVNNRTPNYRTDDNAVSAMGITAAGIANPVATPRLGLAFLGFSYPTFYVQTIFGRAILGAAALVTRNPVDITDSALVNHSVTTFNGATDGPNNNYNIYFTGGFSGVTFDISDGTNNDYTEFYRHHYATGPIGVSGLQNPSEVQTAHCIIDVDALFCQLTTNQARSAVAINIGNDTAVGAGAKFIKAAADNYGLHSPDVNTGDPLRDCARLILPLPDAHLHDPIGTLYNKGNHATGTGAAHPFGHNFVQIIFVNEDDYADFTGTTANIERINTVYVNLHSTIVTPSDLSAAIMTALNTTNYQANWFTGNGQPDNGSFYWRNAVQTGYGHCQPFRAFPTQTLPGQYLQTTSGSIDWRHKQTFFTGTGATDAPDYIGDRTASHTMQWLPSHAQGALCNFSNALAPTGGLAESIDTTLGSSATTNRVPTLLVITDCGHTQSGRAIAQNANRPSDAAQNEPLDDGEFYDFTNHDYIHMSNRGSYRGAASMGPSLIDPYGRHNATYVHRLTPYQNYQPANYGTLNSRTIYSSVTDALQHLIVRPMSGGNMCMPDTNHFANGGIPIGKYLPHSRITGTTGSTAWGAGQRTVFSTGFQTNGFQAFDNKIRRAHDATTMATNSGHQSASGFTRFSVETLISQQWPGKTVTKGGDKIDIGNLVIPNEHLVFEDIAVIDEQGSEVIAIGGSPFGSIILDYEGIPEREDTLTGNKVTSTIPSFVDGAKFLSPNQRIHTPNRDTIPGNIVVRTGYDLMQAYQTLSLGTGGLQTFDAANDVIGVSPSDFDAHDTTLYFFTRRSSPPSLSYRETGDDNVFEEGSEVTNTYIGNNTNANDPSSGLGAYPAGTTRLFAAQSIADIVKVDFNGEGIPSPKDNYWFDITTGQYIDDDTNYNTIPGAGNPGTRQANLKWRRQGHNFCYSGINDGRDGNSLLFETKAAYNGFAHLAVDGRPKEQDYGAALTGTTGGAGFSATAKGMTTTITVVAATALTVTAGTVFDADGGYVAVVGIHPTAVSQFNGYARYSSVSGNVLNDFTPIINKGLRFGGGAVVDAFVAGATVCQAPDTHQSSWENSLRVCDFAGEIEVNGMQKMTQLPQDRYNLMGFAYRSNASVVLPPTGRTAYGRTAGGTIGATRGTRRGVSILWEKGIKPIPNEKAMYEDDSPAGTRMTNAAHALLIGYTDSGEASFGADPAYIPSQLKMGGAFDGLGRYRVVINPGMGGGATSYPPVKGYAGAPTFTAPDGGRQPQVVLGTTNGITTARRGNPTHHINQSVSHYEPKTTAAILVNPVSVATTQFQDFGQSPFGGLRVDESRANIDARTYTTGTSAEGAKAATWLITDTPERVSWADRDDYRNIAGTEVMLDEVILDMDGCDDVMHDLTPAYGGQGGGRATLSLGKVPPLGIGAMDSYWFGDLGDLQPEDTANGVIPDAMICLWHPSLSKTIATSSETLVDSVTTSTGQIAPLHYETIRYSEVYYPGKYRGTLEPQMRQRILHAGHLDNGATELTEPLYQPLDRYGMSAPIYRGRFSLTHRNKGTIGSVDVTAGHRPQGYNNGYYDKGGGVTFQQTLNAGAAPETLAGATITESNIQLVHGTATKDTIGSAGPNQNGRQHLERLTNVALHGNPHVKVHLFRREIASTAFGSNARTMPSTAHPTEQVVDYTDASGRAMSPTPTVGVTLNRKPPVRAFGFYPAFDAGGYLSASTDDLMGGVSELFIPEASVTTRPIEASMQAVNPTGIVATTHTNEPSIGRGYVRASTAAPDDDEPTVGISRILEAHEHGLLSPAASIGVNEGMSLLHRGGIRYGEMISAEKPRVGLDWETITEQLTGNTVTYSVAASVAFDLHSRIQYGQRWWNEKTLTAATLQYGDSTDITNNIPVGAATPPATGTTWNSGYINAAGAAITGINGDPLLGASNHCRMPVMSNEGWATGDVFYVSSGGVNVEGPFIVTGKHSGGGSGVADVNYVPTAGATRALPSIDFLDLATGTQGLQRNHDTNNAPYSITLVKVDTGQTWTVGSHTPGAPIVLTASSGAGHYKPILNETHGLPFAGTIAVSSEDVLNSNKTDNALTMRYLRKVDSKRIQLFDEGVSSASFDLEFNRASNQKNGNRYFTWNRLGASYCLMQDKPRLETFGDYRYTPKYGLYDSSRALMNAPSLSATSTFESGTQHRFMLTQNTLLHTRSDASRLMHDGVTVDGRFYAKPAQCLSLTLVGDLKAAFTLPLQTTATVPTAFTMLYPEFVDNAVVLYRLDRNSDMTWSVQAMSGKDFAMLGTARLKPTGGTDEVLLTYNPTDGYGGTIRNVGGIDVGTAISDLGFVGGFVYDGVLQTDTRINKTLPSGVTGLTEGQREMMLAAWGTTPKQRLRLSGLLKQQSRFNLKNMEAASLEDAGLPKNSAVIGAHFGSVGLEAKSSVMRLLNDVMFGINSADTQRPTTPAQAGTLSKDSTKAQTAGYLYTAIDYRGVSVIEALRALGIREGKYLFFDRFGNIMYLPEIFGGTDKVVGDRTGIEGIEKEHNQDRPNKMKVLGDQEAINDYNTAIISDAEMIEKMGRIVEKSRKIPGIRNKTDARIAGMHLLRKARVQAEMVNVINSMASFDIEPGDIIFIESIAHRMRGAFAVFECVHTTQPPATTITAGEYYRGVEWILRDIELNANISNTPLLNREDPRKAMSVVDYSVGDRIKWRVQLLGMSRHVSTAHMIIGHNGNPRNQGLIGKKGESGIVIGIGKDVFRVIVHKKGA